jgi:hypothetical protein
LRSIPVLFLFLFLVLSASSLVNVHGQVQTQYSIPVHPAQVGFNVDIQIPSQPAWAHQAVLDAMGIWNQAQTWFKETYYPTGRAYKFAESPSGNIHVIFEYLVDSYCGSTGDDIRLVLSNGKNETQSPAVVTSCALHEFGHLLGLEHTKVSRDLMSTDPWSPPSYPSTLDLYAVHMQCEGLVTVRKTVYLPNDIPYMTVPEEAVPEFDNGLVILVVSAFLLIAFRRSRQAPPREQPRE